MKRSNSQLGVGFVLLSVVAGACVAEREPEGVIAAPSVTPEIKVSGSFEASQVVTAVRGQLERALGKPNFSNVGSSSTSGLLGSFDQVRTNSVANVDLLSPDGAVADKPMVGATVDLPLRADGAFRVRDEQSGVTVDVGLVGATTASREDSSGYVVYRSGYAQGAHVIHRPTGDGTEDYVYFPEKLPETPELRYEVALGESVAGLRFVGQTLEMLDAEGAPRLRMHQPYAVDGEGRRLAVGVQIEGCAYDDNLLLPWGRPTVNPGARRCTIRLSWDATAKAPLVVDPEWQHTGNMKETRLNATATLLGNGKVLVAGGEPVLNAQIPLYTAEIYDPKSKTWTNTGNTMMKPRAEHATVAVGNDAIAIGGRGTNSWEKYTTATNAWTGVDLQQYMLVKRRRHTATFIPSKNGILVTGGTDDLAIHPTAEFLSLNTNLFTSAGAMIVPRMGHTATFIDQGRVLIVGGEGHPEAPDSAEIFNSNAPDPIPAWSAAGALTSGHVNHQAVKLPNKVVILGGNMPFEPPMLLVPSKAVDVLDLTTGMWTMNNPAMITARTNFGATIVPGTEAIVAVGGLVSSGANAPAPSKLAEVWRPDGVAWEPLPEMNAARSHFNAVGVPLGHILAAGGTPGGVPGVAVTAEVLVCLTDDDCANTSYCAIDNTCKPRKANGETCDDSANGADKCLNENCRVCQSGNCTDGYCCNQPCDGNCETCDGSSFGVSPGLCVAVAGQPIINELNDFTRTACVGDGDCAGTCNGIERKKCSYPKGNACDTKCNTETNKFESLVCDGMGACSAVAFAQSCSPYVCGAENKCEITCDSNATDPTKTGCDDTSVCSQDGACVPSSTQCIDDHTMKLPDGTPVDCGYFQCKNTACLTACSNAYDCIVHPDPTKAYVCNESSQCVEGEFEKTDETAVSCSTSTGSDSSRFGWMFALAAAAVAVRRNRARS